MNIKHLFILLILLFIIISYLSEIYKKKKVVNNEENKEFINNNIKEDNTDLYINPYLTNEILPNIIKKYNDQKISIYPSFNNKNEKQEPINKNHLMNFLNFLVRI